MEQHRDENSGVFTQQYSKSSFLQAVNECENATTTKISEEVGCSYNLAYRRLTALFEDGEINRTKIGSSYLWLPP